MVGREKKSLRKHEKPPHSFELELFVVRLDSSISIYQYEPKPLRHGCDSMEPPRTAFTDRVRSGSSEAGIELVILARNFDFLHKI